jgi:TolB-like protein/Flp pilus assembly protein TadD
LLLERAGEVVTRDELRDKLWAADTFVDFDVGLNSIIRKLRDTFGDSAENPRFIETLPKRGYRFIGPVKPAMPDPIPDPPVGSTKRPGWRARPAWIAGGLVLTAAIGTLALALERGWSERLRAGSVAAPIRSLAVLPFDNLTGDPGQDYFVNGMTDALTTELAQIGGLEVISRTSAMQYERAKKPLPAIGRELNVDALLEGAIARSGQRVRITAQLVHAATDRHVWAQTYESELRDVLTLQQQITRAIAAAIQGRLAPPPARAERRWSVDPQAYDAYLKGIAIATQQTPDGFRNAVAYFEDAVTRQPDFALAHAALAMSQLQLLYGGPLSPREIVPKAEAAARKALELDDTLREAHQALGVILRDFHWQWEEGDQELLRASSRRADPADTRRAVRRKVSPEEVIANAERARARNTLSFDAYVNVATAYRAAGQYDRAIAELRRALEIPPGHNRAHFQLGVTFTLMGRFTDAIDSLETAFKLSQRNLRFLAYLGYAYAAAGRPLDARRILNELESRARQQYVSSFGRALIHDALGEEEPALAALERAYEDHAVEFAQMRQYPPFKTIASEPRYQAVMRRIGLPR